jgi:hypothetical protein
MAALGLGVQAAEKAPATKSAPTESAPNPGKAPATSKKGDSTKPTPYHGKVTAVDPAGKSVSIKGAVKDRVFQVTDKTKVVGKDGQPAKVASIPVGEEIRGTATKSDDKWTAVSIYIGPKDATPGKEEKGKKGKKSAEKAAEETASPKAGSPTTDTKKPQ